jgi:PKHD-type hydroxylase
MSNMFTIPDVLNPEELAQVRQLLSDCSFVDGKTTAGTGSNYQKNNLQGDPNDSAVQQAQEIIHAALSRHPKFRILAVPRVVRHMTVNRYDVGMYYDEHMDHAVLSGTPQIRGDMSATVFLSDPQDYDGGEMLINTDAENPEKVKLPAGHAVVYSAATMHRVTPVTRGSRLGAVTTIESMIRDPVKRQLMGEVSQLTRWVQDVAARSPQERMANKIYVNLMRLWIDP